MPGRWIFMVTPSDIAGAAVLLLIIGMAAVGEVVNRIRRRRARGRWL